MGWVIRGSDEGRLRGLVKKYFWWVVGGEDAKRDGAMLSLAQGFNIQSMLSLYTRSVIRICISSRIIFILTKGRGIY